MVGTHEATPNADWETLAHHAEVKPHPHKTMYTYAMLQHVISLMQQNYSLIPGHSKISSCSCMWRKISLQLRKKLWEWPGKEAS